MSFDRKIYRPIFGLLVLFLSCFSMLKPLHAGGSISVDTTGHPIYWDTQQTLQYNPENGELSEALGVQGSRALLHQAFQTWASIPGIELQIGPGETLPEINENNFQQFLGVGTEECYPEFFPVSGNDCRIPIIFDARGEIIAALFGQGAQHSILGFAGPDTMVDESGDPARLVIRSGQAVFNGACLPPALTGCPRTLSIEEMLTVMIHEGGHLLGMDHAQVVDPEVYAACNASPEGCPEEFASAVPTMFPILMPNAQMQDLHADDIAYFRHLYGDALNYGCRVEGTVYASDGQTEVRGVEVVAINNRSFLLHEDRMSFVSGAEAPKKNIESRRQGNCTENCGQYQITHLKSGDSYRLCVQKISPQFSGGSSIEPVDPPFQLFSDDCPQDLVVHCECPPDELCPVLSGVNIITDTNPEDIDQSGDEPDNLELGNQNGGGCSLMKPRFRPTHFWQTLKISVKTPFK